MSVFKVVYVKKLQNFNFIEVYTA